METKTAFSNVDEYIACFPIETQKILKQIRKSIMKVAPKAEEVISYQMPAYKQDGVLVYFAAYKNHIGFYPTASGIEAFKEDISVYKSSKGAVQFPIDEPMPLELIERIVRYRIEANELKSKKKKTTKA
jgi:uncharacterized protein YdhG (YjbR/CyaY superfamily)